VYVIKANISADPVVRDKIVAGTRTAAAIAEHKHLVHTLAAGLTGDILWIATEEVDGQLVRDMLIKKKQAGTSGFGMRGTSNIMSGVTKGLSEVMHGSLATESVIVSRTGRVRIVDLALGPGTLAAMKAGLIPMQNNIAPEVQVSGVPSSAGDVYGVGALFYEALTGIPLERGGPRPSEAVQGATPQVDELVARSCHPKPEKRYGHVDVLGEALAEALGKSEVSQMTKLPPAPTAAAAEPGAASSLAMSIGDIEASGNSVVDRALSAALADSTEKFLISKGRLDYGPFSLADVVAQIEKGDIVAGNIIMDKDSGSRGDVAEHPLLGPIVDATRQRRDDQRRAQAEIKVQSADKKRGVALYGVIAMAVITIGVGAFFGYNKFIKADDSKKKAATVAKLEGAELKVTVSLPKVPPAKKRTGGHSGGGGGGGGRYNDNMSLDLSDDSDETETLGMDKVYAVYSHYGAQLGGCVASNGGGSANIGIIIDGPSGRVKGVRVNGQDTGGLHSCIWRVMQKMQFPKINGPRTRAEFDIGV
jgi:serine/threonine protein kinase